LRIHVESLTIKLTMYYKMRTTILCNFLATWATLALANPASNIGNVKHPLWYQPPSEKTLELAKIDDLSQTVVSDGERGEKGVLASTLKVTDEQAAKIKAGNFTVAIAMGWLGDD
jgi:ribose transport system substrate-binding protein